MPAILTSMVWSWPSAGSRSFQIDVVGPTRGNFRWQARNQQGFEGHQFQIDWAAHHAICPQGHTSYDRRPGRNHAMMTVHFARADCQPCPLRRSCTRAASRSLTLHPHDEELALRAARQREKTPEFATAYAPRAGVEASHLRPGPSPRWAPPVPLHWVGQDPSAAPTHCHRAQSPALGKLAQRNAARPNPRIGLHALHGHGPGCLTTKHHDFATSVNSDANLRESWRIVVDREVRPSPIFSDFAHLDGHQHAHSEKFDSPPSGAC